MAKSEDWERHLDVQAKSGQSIAAYCRERGLSKRALYKYRLKQKEKTSKQAAFVQIGAGESEGEEHIELVLGERIRIKIPLTYGLKRVMEELDV